MIQWERNRETILVTRRFAGGLCAALAFLAVLPTTVLTAAGPAAAASPDRIVVPNLRMKGVRVERRGGMVVIGMRGRILFDYDRAALRPEAYATLARIASALQHYYPWSPLRIEGHTDSHGDEAYNYSLSRARAAAVRAGFLRYGIAYHRLQVLGYGETRPIAPNAYPDGRDNPAGRQANRRVEIVVVWPYRRPYPYAHRNRPRSR